MKRALTALLFASFPLLAQEAPYTESIDVVRYLVHARVVDSTGRPMTGLTASDFSVKVDGNDVDVEEASWVGSREAFGSESAEGSEAGDSGRLIVFFIQTDFGRDSRRIAGQLAFNPLADEILEALEPSARIAVVSLDSHLNVIVDFTRDREVVRAAVRDAIAIRRRELPEPPASGPSLARILDRATLHKTLDSEAGLLVLANALHSIDGDKTIILAGWGIGRRSRGLVMLTAKWQEAMTLLQNDHIPVITLSTGTGGQLSAGLGATASATSSMYATTRSFPSQAVTRVQGVLAGYYELVLRSSPPLEPGQHPLLIRVPRKDSRVFAPKNVTVNRESRVTMDIVDLSEASAGPAVREQEMVDLYVAAMRSVQDGETDAAIEQLDKLLLRPDAPSDAWYQRAMLLGGRGDLEPATRDLRKYLELEPAGRYARDARELVERWK
jgi:hypothetical protein